MQVKQSLNQSVQSLILPVPYWAQPTIKTCQSTCIKMMATYFERNGIRTSPPFPTALNLNIMKIYDEINTSEHRPVKNGENNVTAQ